MAVRRTAGPRAGRSGPVWMVCAALAVPCTLLPAAAYAQTGPPQHPLTEPAAPQSPLTGAVPPIRLAPETPAAPSQRIAEIVVRGGKTVSPETIGFYLGVKPGDPYDEAAIQRGFTKLWDSGLFEDVRLEKEETPAGVRIVAVVVERPRVADLEFRGNKKLTTSQLKDKLKEGKAEIRIGGAISLHDVAKAKAALLEAYRAEGFRSAAVEATIETMGNENDRRVVFLIDEGDKIKIQRIRFTGNTVVSAGRLRRAMKKTHQTHWWKFWDSKDVYNQANYDEDVEAIRHVYQDRGYKDVVVKDPVLETFVVNPAQKKPEKIKRRVNITIPIVEGDKFFFGDVTVDGATVFDPKVLLKRFVYKKGRPLSRAALVDGMKSVEEMYRSKGYIYLYENPEYTEKPGHLVDVSVKITEGDQYHLGRVEFVGNKTTRDKVLRRELTLTEGDILDMEAFRKGVLKITQLGYFKIEEDPEFKVDGERKAVDVTVKGQDTNRNEVQFGAGYSQLDGLFGQFQFATRNFLGRGDTLGLQFQRGANSNFFDVSFVEPWFLDERMSVGASVFNRSLTYFDIDQRTKGVSLSYGLQLGLWDVATIFYGFTDTHSRYQVFPAPVPPGGGQAPPAYGDFFGRTSSITPGYRFDSRNDPFDPSRGLRYGASVTVAGGPFGGEFSYLKPDVGFTGYFPTGKHTNAALNLEFSMIRPYQGREIPIFERFRLGGDRSIRGFQQYSIWPIDKNNVSFINSEGALLGGDRMLVVNLEYVYAFAGPLKVAAFFDAGNAWAEGQSMNLLKLRASTGLEVRVFLPIFQAPLRFIYGINLDPKTIYGLDGQVLLQEKRSDFQFSIGTTF